MAFAFSVSTSCALSFYLPVRRKASSPSLRMTSEKKPLSASNKSSGEILCNAKLENNLCFFKRFCVSIWHVLNVDWTTFRTFSTYRLKVYWWSISRYYRLQFEQCASSWFFSCSWRRWFSSSKSCSCLWMLSLLVFQGLLSRLRDVLFKGRLYLSSWTFFFFQRSLTYVNLCADSSFKLPRCYYYRLVSLVFESIPYFWVS